MDIKRFTLIAGVLFVLVGILGFIPGITTAPHVNDPNLAVDASYGRLFGLFPVNVLHNLVHLAFGVWALVAAKDFAQSRIFCKSTAIIYAVLTIAGLIPGLSTVFGLIPLQSHDIWLHAIIAVGAAYYGFVNVSDEMRLGAGPAGRTTATSSSTNLRWS
jgi:hypothetical protein